MNTYAIKDFKYGTINTIEPQSIPDGAMSDSKNWLTKGDKMELRRGYETFGTEDTTTYPAYIHTGYTANNTEVVFKKVGAKLYYYNTTTEDWAEIGSNLFTAAGVNDIPSFANYTTNAGNMVFISSTNSGLFKIMTANPGSYTSLYADGTNYKGNMKIQDNRMWLWNTKEDKTGIYISHIDEATYTTVENEDIGNTDGTTKTFTATLAFKAAGATRTCFGIYVTCAGSTEVFEDNYNGVLVGSEGGTGTINYTSGAISVTYHAAPTTGNDILVDYQWENSNVNGITDFTYSSPRVPGEGNIIRQDAGGGDIQNIITYHDVEYVFHKTKTWKISFGDTDTTIYNKVWRENVGINNIFSACITGDGIYYIDLTNGDVPKFRLATMDVIAEEVIPQTVSENIDLSDYLFDKAAIFEYGDYILFSARYYKSDANDIVFAYNKVWKSIDKLDWTISQFGIYNHYLIGGSITNGDVFRLFHNYVDNLEYALNNYMVGNYSEIGAERLKKIKKIVLEGEMSRDQSFDFYIALDNGAWQLAATIDGDGAYVDTTSGRTVLGDYVIGDEMIGGGDTETIYHYKYGFKIKTIKFHKIIYKIVSHGIGYLSVSMIEYWDIRSKNYKLPKKYR